MWGSSLVAQLVKNPPATQETACNAGDRGSIPGLRRSSGEGNGNPLWHSCLGNSMDRRTWQATVYRVAKSRTRPSDFTFTFFQGSKHLLISWLQSPSAVILEPPKNKVSYCFHCFPIYLPRSDGTRCHNLSFLNIEL